MLFCLSFVASLRFFFFFFNDTATTEIYTLSLHDALPIFDALHPRRNAELFAPEVDVAHHRASSGRRAQADAARRRLPDRKSTRLNSSHDQISYAVFCLKKKKQHI